MAFRSSARDSSAVLRDSDSLNTATFDQKVDLLRAGRSAEALRRVSLTSSGMPPDTYERGEFLSDRTDFKRSALGRRRQPVDARTIAERQRLGVRGDVAVSDRGEVADAEIIGDEQFSDTVIVGVHELRDRPKLMKWAPGLVRGPIGGPAGLIRDLIVPDRSDLYTISLRLATKLRGDRPTGPVSLRANIVTDDAFAVRPPEERRELDRRMLDRVLGYRARAAGAANITFTTTDSRLVLAAADVGYALASPRELHAAYGPSSLSHHVVNAGFAVGSDGYKHSMQAAADMLNAMIADSHGLVSGEGSPSNPAFFSLDEATGELRLGAPDGYTPAQADQFFRTIKLGPFLSSSFVAGIPGGPGVQIFPGWRYTDRLGVTMTKRLHEVRPEHKERLESVDPDVVDVIGPDDAGGPDVPLRVFVSGPGLSPVGDAGEGDDDDIYVGEDIYVDDGDDDGTEGPFPEPDSPPGPGHWTEF